MATPASIALERAARFCDRLGRALARDQAESDLLVDWLDNGGFDATVAAAVAAAAAAAAAPPCSPSYFEIDSGAESDASVATVRLDADSDADADPDPDLDAELNLVLGAEISRPCAPAPMATRRRSFCAAEKGARPRPQTRAYARARARAAPRPPPASPRRTSTASRRY